MAMHRQGNLCARANVLARMPAQPGEASCRSPDVLRSLKAEAARLARRA